MAQNMWRFRTKHFEVRWDISEDIDTDLSWDDTGEVARRIEDGTYQVFLSHVYVVLKETGTIIAEDYLGGSIYSDPADFRDHIGRNSKGHGSYFSDMVRFVCKEARGFMADVQAIRCRREREAA